MSSVSPGIEELTRRILALEAARAKAAHIRVDEAVQVCLKLQASLSRLTGPGGYSSLLSRALALAKVDVPTLQVVQVRPDGSLSGFDEIMHDGNTQNLEKGRMVLVTQLLSLLATFIGESLTRRLACDVWPDTALAQTDLKSDETS